MAKKKTSAKKRINNLDTPENKFIDALSNHGVEHVDEFQDGLLDLLKETKTQKKVIDIFPNFAPNSRAHEFLISLREKDIARPQGGGPWTTDSYIAPLAESFKIAKETGLKIKPLIFISYSHMDEKWKERIVEHLKVLEKAQILSVWEDDVIEPGSNWFVEIEGALIRADAAFLLISPSFLNSEFIFKEEIPKLLDHGKSRFRVYPILVRPCAWEAIDWLSKIQIRPRGKTALSSLKEYEIDEKLAKITLELKELLKAIEEET